MYVQVTNISYQRERLDEAEAIVRDSILPAAAKQPGFVKAYWAVDRATGKCVAMSVWRTREDADAVLESGFYQEQVAKAAPLLAGEPTRETYELALEA